MAVLKTTFKAGTLLEAVMAMGVVVFCIGAGLTIYLNTFKAFNHYKNVKANLLLNDIALDLKTNHKIAAVLMELEQFNVNVNILPTKYDNIKTLQMSLEEKGGAVIKTRKELIYIEDEDN